jgi:hypothetical protein
MNNCQTGAGCEKAASASANVQIGLAPKPERDSNAEGMPPKALRFV